MAKKPAPTAKLPIWVWLLAGLALAGLVMFLILLSELKHPEYSGTKKSPQSTSTDAPKTDDHFDFYTTLKETVIPVKESLKAQYKQKIADNRLLFLQVASFRELSDAKQVQAELVLLGLSSSIEKSRSANGETWHRIISGPFKTRSKQQSARNTLLSNRYSPLLIKRKPKKR